MPILGLLIWFILSLFTKPAHQLNLIGAFLLGYAAYACSLFEAIKNDTKR